MWVKEGMQGQATLVEGSACVLPHREDGRCTPMCMLFGLGSDCLLFARVREILFCEVL